MVFCSFIRAKCCPVNIKFFQSSATYLNNQSLTKYWHQYTRLYNGEGPHPSQHSQFMSIDFGHYGLYYSIFNRDGDNYRSNNINILFFNPLINFHLPIYEQAFKPAKRPDVKSSVFAFAMATRSFSTSSKVSSEFSKVSESNTKVTDALEEVREKAVEEIKEVKQEETETLQTTQTTSEPIDEKFTDLSATLDSLYTTKQYSLIYPIYQSLKRNNQSLASADEYNKVLNSILARPVDSSVDLYDIETRLTNLLTVYQDLLGTVKPNNETFNLVLTGLLDGSIGSINYSHKANLPVGLYNEAFIKSQEFILITLELLLSVKDIKQLNLNVLYPKLFEVLNEFPNLANKQLLTLIFNNLIVGSRYFKYHHQLINLTEQFMKFGLLTSSKECYDFLFHIYSNYQKGQFDVRSDFKIYQSLMIQLIKTDNFEVSTRFLDDILLRYKSKNFDKRDVSNLISNYLLEVSSFDLSETFKLMKEFNKVSYIPELSMSFYNEMINRLIHSYGKSEVAQKQEIYNQIWDIVNYNLVRKDFKLNSNVVNFAIECGDYDNIFKLSKVLLLSNELMDLNSFKNLLVYYSNGLSYNFEVYYDLILRLVEHQSKFYETHGKLNDYFSEVVDFLVIPNNQFVHKSLVNSSMIKQIFNKFDLVNDKIYGLIKFARYLVENKPYDETLKVVHFQSLLINEFENPELVYVNLDEDLSNFKAELMENFRKESDSLDDITTPMKLTFSYLDMETPNKKVIQPVQTVNLSTIMRVNYHIGVAQFIESFKNGCKFTDDTLEVLINKEFLINHLHKVNVNKFVKLYTNQRLLNLLVQENIDSLTIAVLKNTEIDEQMFNLILDNCLTSSNKYLFNLFNTIRIPLDDEQMTKYLQLLKKNEEYGQINDIFAANESLINDTDNLVVYLDTLLVTKQFGRFNEVIKTKFSDKQSVSSILENDELRTLVNDYYVVTNSDVTFFKPKRFSSINNLTNELFNQLNNHENLQTVYKLNQKLININQQLVVGNLLTKILNYNLSYKMMMNFVNISNITKISIVNFKKLIKILANDELKLNSLFQRFINSKFSNYIKFELFEVLVAENEKLDILNLFRDCFRGLESDINLFKIDVIMSNDVCK